MSKAIILEKNAMEEDVVDLHIYSTLILLKFRPIELNVRKVKTLIGEVRSSAARDSRVARNSGAGFSPELDRGP